MKPGDIVRVLKYPEDHMNAYAMVQFVLPNGNLILVNMNMPFQGTISMSSGQFKPSEVNLLGGTDDS
jgi:hypothetical protein